MAHGVPYDTSAKENWWKELFWSRNSTPLPIPIHKPTAVMIKGYWPIGVVRCARRKTA